jgi:hypothetical protein
MIYQTVQQFKKMLGNLSNFLDKGAQLAEAKKFDSINLVNSRLAPDQFPLVKQVQTACDTTKGLVARLTGKEAPKHEDNEQTIEELKARINKVIGYVSEFRQEDFDGAATRKIELPFIMAGHYITGEEYMVEFAIPNFYFHVTTAYDILRHNGVDLGKRDLIGSVPFKPL